LRPFEIENPSGTAVFLIEQNAVATSTLRCHLNGYLEQVEQGTEPAAPLVNRSVLFARDNGAGKTQLCVKFNTGAVQVIATEP
jgi:hypothetical protein